MNHGTRIAIIDAMKATNKVIITVIVMILTAVASNTSADAQNKGGINWWKKTFGTLTWDEVIQASETREDVVGYVSGTVAYKSDAIDQWAGGKETWERGYGDCEDIAATVTDICKAKGWDAWIEVFTFKKSLSGHAIAMGMKEGKYWFYCGSYQEAGSMDEVRRMVARRLKWDGEGVSSLKVTDKSQVEAILVASK